MKNHLVIPDCQVRPGVKTDHLDWLNYYIGDACFDDLTIICLGDFWDFPSLSSYDKAGSKATWNRDFPKDLEAGKRAFDKIADWSKVYRCVFTEGNHEERVHRYNNLNPAVPIENHHEHVVRSAGWSFVPFQETVTIDGITYSHMSCLGPDGQTSATTARRGQSNATTQAKREMRSFVAGHKQGLTFDVIPRGGNRLIYSMISGSFYGHHEKYQTPQGKNYWRGFHLFEDVRNGHVGLVSHISLDWLKRNYK